MPHVEYASPVLTTEESLHYLKTSRSSFYRLREAGRIKAVYLGTRKPFFRKSDLDEFIDSCSVNGH